MKKLIICLIILLISPVYAGYRNPELTSGITQTSLLKSYKDESKNSLVINNMKKQTQLLSQNDKNVITKYVFGAVKGEDSFLLMNCYLRGNLEKHISETEITKLLEARLEFYSNQLTQSLSKSKLPKNMILYSGDSEILNIDSQVINEENLRNIRKNIIGREFIDEGFLTASYDKNFSAKSKIRYEIKAPKNLQAVMLDGLGRKESRQIILNKGYKWKITDITMLADKETKQKYYNVVIKVVL